MKLWMMGLALIALLSLTSCTYVKTGCFGETAQKACALDNRTVSHVFEGGLSGGPYFICVDSQGIADNKQRLFSLEQKAICSNYSRG